MARDRARKRGLLTRIWVGILFVLLALWVVIVFVESIPAVYRISSAVGIFLALGAEFLRTVLRGQWSKEDTIRFQALCMGAVFVLVLKQA